MSDSKPLHEHSRYQQMRIAINQLLASLDFITSLQADDPEIPPFWIYELEDGHHALHKVITNARAARCTVHLTSEQGRAP
jgi:hypothetical protein